MALSDTIRTIETGEMNYKKESHSHTLEWKQHPIGLHQFLSSVWGRGNVSVPAACDAIVAILF